MTVTVQKTAGMVCGTPDWQLNRLYEKETGEMLEKAMNTPDDFPASVAASDMDKAHAQMSRACSFLCRAASLAERYGVSTKEMDQFIERLEELQSDISLYKDMLEGKQ